MIDLNKPMDGTDLYPYNTGDYKRSDWDILTFINNGEIIDKNHADFNKWLELHLTIDKNHPCGGPSYECEIKIHSVRNNLNSNILILGENHGLTSRIGSEKPVNYGPITRLWVCLEQMRVDEKSGGVPISNWLFNTKNCCSKRFTECPVNCECIKQ